MARRARSVPASLLAASLLTIACASEPTGSDEHGSETAGETGSDGCEPVLNQADLETGFEICEDGSKHRHVALECPSEATSPTSPCMDSTCSADADCDAQPLGYCADAHALTGYCGCFYGCRSDADCDAGSLCECGVVVGQCVAATCTTDADCGPELGCVSTLHGSSGACVFDPPHSYTCQTAADECQADADCPNVGSEPGACLFDGEHRVCGTICEQTP